jgi:hypothetical protein
MYGTPFSKPLMNELCVPQNRSGQEQGVDTVEDAAMAWDEGS